jgi:hypothetical protein
MLIDAKDTELLPQFLADIASVDVKNAFVFLVGAGACNARYRCCASMKGVIRVFRIYEGQDTQPFAFIVNRESLLFYFRAPAVQSGAFSLADLSTSFPVATENNSGEWTVRVSSLADAMRLWSYLDARHGFISGEAPTTQIGYVNRNNQRCSGHRGIAGTDHLQRAYRMECLEPDCGSVYGANGSDVFQRRCPDCQGGEPGLGF